MRAQCPSRLAQHHGGDPTKRQQSHAQDAQVQAKPEGDALDRGECAQDGSGLLLEGGPAQAALLPKLMDSLRGATDPNQAGGSGVPRLLARLTTHTAKAMQPSVPSCLKPRGARPSFLHGMDGGNGEELPIILLTPKQREKCAQ
jgi:hypothetical protein